MSLKSPVAFFVFNRPDLTMLVLEAIRKVKPQKLLVIADGPRLNNSHDLNRCKEVRNIIDKVDWDCDVLKNYSDFNIGCRKRVSSGLDWVFSEVEDAIILEDDCLPTESFFNFCEELLNKYRDNEQIMHISGNNFQDEISRTQYTYYFSKYSHIWGWASWRRAWKYYDVDMKTWPEIKSSKLLSNICEDIYEAQYWEGIFDGTYAGLIDTWDYQWLYTCWIHMGCSIVPDVNLVSNIGFRNDGVNCKSPSKYANMVVKDIWDIEHPLNIKISKEADRYTFDNHFGGHFIKFNKSIKGRIINKIKYIRDNVLYR